MIVVSLLMGALGVLQNTLNKQHAASLGFGATILINGIVVCVSSFVLFFALRLLPLDSLPEIFRPLAASRALRPLDILPGVFGFLIIASLPWVIERQGAIRVFIAIIAGQIVMSVVWDLFVESSGLDWKRAMGAGLALLGVLVASL